MKCTTIAPAAKPVPAEFADCLPPPPPTRHPAMDGPLGAMLFALYGDAPAVAEPAQAGAPVDPWDVEADPADWPADCDDDVWTPCVPASDAAGPSAEDQAFEAGRAVALDCEGPCEAPAHYTPAERSAFLGGLTEGARVYHERELDRLDRVAWKLEAEALLAGGVPAW